MSLPVVWLSEAVQELNEAVSWYTGVRPELGIRFVHAVDEAVERIAGGPLLYALKEELQAGGSSPVPLWHILRRGANRIVVIACFHGSEIPGIGRPVSFGPPSNILMVTKVDTSLTHLFCIVLRKIEGGGLVLQPRHLPL